MNGFQTLWLPGTDHAGIITQLLVEKDLEESGVTKHDLGRDNFLSKVECDNLINYYKANEKFSKQWRDVYPLACNVEDIKYKLNVISKEYGAEVDWFEIVKWPIGSKQDLHFDMAKKDTVLSSIIYLNDNFEEKKKKILYRWKMGLSK